MQSAVVKCQRVLLVLGLIVILLPLGGVQAAPVASAETWVYTGSMNNHHAEHTATLLNDGKVLVAGGVNGTGPIQTAELYDPKTGKWSFTGSMNTTRAIHTATLLNNGKVLVTGGEDSNFALLASAELYDPTTGKWSLTGSMSFRRLFHTATLLPDGKVLVTGGISPDDPAPGSTTSAELYDPSTGKWSVTGSMHIGRELHTSTLLNNAKVLVTGGFTFIDTPPNQTAELYDPSTGTWSLVSHLMLAGRGGHTATLLPNGQVLLAGGTTFRVTELYDTGTGDFSSAGDLNVPRANHTATLLPNGEVLVAGGATSIPLSSAELWNPGTKTWSNTASLNAARNLYTATLISNGTQVLAAGGFGDVGTLDSAELFVGFAPSAGLPDLVPTVLRVPTSAIVGTSLLISWQVKNQGPVRALPPWTDALYLSTDNVLSPDDARLGSVERNSALGRNSSYYGSLNLTVPNVVSGTYYLILRTNDTFTLEESNLANNVRSMPISIQVPDLVPTKLAAPDSGLGGQSIPVSWTVLDQSTGSAMAPWDDRLYLSTDDVLDGTDTPLVTVARTSALSAGNNYAVTRWVTLPKVTTGSYFLILRTDDTNKVVEANETNNVQVVPITIN